MLLDTCITPAERLDTRCTDCPTLLASNRESLLPSLSTHQTNNLTVSSTKLLTSTLPNLVLQLPPPFSVPSGLQTLPSVKTENQLSSTQPQAGLSPSCTARSSTWRPRKAFQTPSSTSGKPLQMENTISKIQKTRNQTTCEENSGQTRAANTTSTVYDLLHTLCLRTVLHGKCCRCLIDILCVLLTSIL